MSLKAEDIGRGVAFGLCAVVVIVASAAVLCWLIPDSRPQDQCHHVTERGKCECP